MQVIERRCFVSILLTSLILLSSCKYRSYSAAFHAQSSKVNHSGLTCSEPVSVDKGQALRASYSLSISEGTWAIWFARAGEPEPHYQYSAYESDHCGSIEYQAPESGKYVLHIESKSFTGSYDVTMKFKK